MLLRSRITAATALLGFAVTCLSGCGAENPVAPSLVTEASGVGRTMEVARKDILYSEVVRGPDGGSLGSDGGATVSPRVRKPKKPKKPKKPRANGE